MSEQTMQERPSEKAPWPKSEDELVAYVREMAAWPAGATEPGEGYGRCVYALAYGALATFNYLASQIGVTGFQASMAEMEFVAQSRDMKHGFLLLDASKLLYPQYDVLGNVIEWIKKTRPQLAPAAQQLLANKRGVHPEVVARWEEIAALGPSPAADASGAPDAGERGGRAA